MDQELLAALIMVLIFVGVIALLGAMYYSYDCYFNRDKYTALRG
jgi:type IV secretory pathway TrbL component